MLRIYVAIQTDVQNSLASLQGVRRTLLRSAEKEAHDQRRKRWKDLYRASTAMNTSVLEAARHGVRAIAMWLEQHGDRELQRAKTQHDRALCTVILNLLAQPEAIPSETEFHCHVVLLAVHSDPDEEWYEVTHWWEVYVRADRIICNEYSNLATIIGAGQTPIREVRSTDEETDLQREHLAAWRAGLDEALLMRGVSVDVGRRSLTR